jgi:hypothetical protein
MGLATLSAILAVCGAMRFLPAPRLRAAELHPGAVDRSRATLKPSIPAVGEHGIRLRDELVLERDLV